jgi:hypothetical protein
VAGKDYYITRPDAIYAYKILHLIQSYSLNPDSFNNDLPHLQRAFTEFYTEEELLQKTHEILKAYEETMARYEDKSRASSNWISRTIKKILERSDVSADVRSVLEKLSIE